MKNRILFFLAIFSSLWVKAQDYERLVFTETCSGQIVKPTFHFCSEALFLFKIKYALEKENFHLYGSAILDFREQDIDTIAISRLLFSIDKTTNEWTFRNCHELAEGIQITHYPNGQKRFEGSFRTGKPYEIKNYRYNGSLFSHKYMEPGTLQANQINYYDENEKLVQTETYFRKKNKTIVKVYDKDGKKIDRSVIKGTHLIQVDIDLPKEGYSYLQPKGSFEQRLGILSTSH